MQSRTYEAHGETLTAKPKQEGDYGVYAKDGAEYVTRVSKHGSLWIAASHPGKKWETLGQAVTYVALMRKANEGM